MRSQKSIPAKSQKTLDSAGDNTATVLNYTVLNVDGTTMRLHFGNSDSLGTQLAKAFNAMLR